MQYYLVMFCGYLLLFICITSAYKVEEHISQEFVVKVSHEDWAMVQDELEAIIARFKKKIQLGYYLFEDDRRISDESTDIIIREIVENGILKEKIKHYERVREYTVETDGEREEASAVSYYNHTWLVPPIDNCPTFTDMGVKDAWAIGYSGRGVVVAVTDVGINTDIPDLQQNIKAELSYNVVNDSGNITPEFCHFNDQADHGNNCAGIIGAARSNGICGDGIVYNAAIVGIKLASVRENVHRETCQVSFRSTWTAQGLLHGIGIVDVYSNSWSSNTDFINRSQLETDTMQAGARTGRNGKGSVYVFPVGQLADPYANDIHTITVNSIAGTGYASSFSHVCACTLTTGYGERGKTATRVLHTTSYLRRSKCTADFQGTSATTAVVSGIVGLALEANPNLTWRDIQDLVVQASEASPLPEYNRFSINGAGKRYHPVLGFGLLNAVKLVRLAETTPGLPEQIQMQGQCSNIVYRGKLRQRSHHYYYRHPCSEATVDITCSRGACINRTESVLLNISYDSPSEYNSELILISPHGTPSLLMDSKQSEEKGSTRRRNVLFQSVTFWGEDARGNWTIAIKQTDYQDHIRITACELTIYGTGYSIPPLSTVKDKHMGMGEGEEHGDIKIINNPTGIKNHTQNIQLPVKSGLGLGVIIGIALAAISFVVIAVCCVYLIYCKRDPRWVGTYVRLCAARIQHNLQEFRRRWSFGYTLQERPQSLFDENSLTELM